MQKASDTKKLEVRMSYKPGDIASFAIDRVSGEAMVIENDAKDAKMLIIAIGTQFTELPAANWRQRSGDSIKTTIGEALCKGRLQAVWGLS